MISDARLASPTVWPHQKLAVYAKAIAAAKRIELIARELPASRGYLRDQLQRASASIVFNIAEGANEFSPGEKAKFFRYARRSAGECESALDLLIAIGLGSTAHQELRDLLHEIGAMLTGLIRRL